VLFRLGESEDEGGGEPVEAEVTIAGTLSADDVHTATATAEPTPAARLAGAPADATVVRPPGARPPPAGPRPRAHRARVGRLRVALGSLLALAIVGGVLAGLYALSRQVYFVGTNDAGLVTLYRGVPYDLPLGLELYDEEYASGVPARAIRASRRRRVLDHEWRSRTDAVDLVRAIERGRLEGSGTSG
jgi:protein phosphatase